MEMKNKNFKIRFESQSGENNGLSTAGRKFRGLFAALAFFGLSIGAINAQTWNIGAGTNPAAVTATLSGTAPNQTLTISGNGAMQDFTASGATSQPWSYYNSKITTLVINNGITNIGAHAFEYCSITGTLSIPNSITSIGEWAFYYCDKLTGNLVIPNTVTSIGNYAFGVCTGFNGSLNIPNSVNSIGNYAFQVCTGLTSITIQRPAPSTITLGTNVFQSVNKNTCILYVPFGCVVAYQNAVQWQDFTNIKEMVCEITAGGTTTQYTDIGDAIVATPYNTPTTIKLLTDITYNGGMTINSKKITFDLNGKKLNVTNSSGTCLVVTNSGKVDLLDATNGELNITGSTGGVSANAGCFAAVTSATATGTGATAAGANGGEITVAGNLEVLNSSGCYGAIAANSGHITVDGKIIVPAGAVYINLQFVDKTAADGVPSSTKPGYLEYVYSTNIVWVGNKATAIDEITADNLRIYPNPVRDELKIDGDVPFDNLPFTIYNLAGNQIVNSHWLNGKSINVSNLPSGVYFLKIETDSGVVTRKFVKE